MPAFAVFEPPARAGRAPNHTDRFVFLRERFSWAAFLFGPLWMIWRRLWLVLIIASVIVWSVARGSGTIDKIESFVDSNFSTDWKFNGDFLLRQVGLVGLVLTMAATLFTTIGAVMFNLISDIIGGVWITVIEDETARPVSGSPPE